MSRLAEIAERAAFDALPVEERHAILRTEIAALSDYEWCDPAKPVATRAGQCREDRTYLLARLAESEARVALLEDLVRTYMSGDADQNTYRAARAALAAAPEERL